MALIANRTSIPPRSSDPANPSSDVAPRKDLVIDESLKSMTNVCSPEGPTFDHVNEN